MKTIYASHFTEIIRNKVRRGIFHQAGFGLVESLVAVAIAGTAVVALLGSLSSGSMAVNIFYEKSTAENLAAAQMEYAKSQPYQATPVSYDTIESLPPGFTVTAEATAIGGRDSYIQKLTVKVYREGRQVYSLEDFRVDK
jgi:type II secretory pathway pseudopilin PulG